MPSGEHPFDGDMILIKNKNKNKNKNESAASSQEVGSDSSRGAARRLD